MLISPHIQHRRINRDRVLNLYWLGQIPSTKYLLMGEKAASLNQLLEDGYPVIPGFVIPAITLRDVLEFWGETEPLLADLYSSHLYVNLDKEEALQSVAKQICQGILKSEIPSKLLTGLLSASQTWQQEALILRPSVTIPHGNRQILPSLWRSQVCLHRAESLAFALKLFWVQLFRARSLFYLQRNNLSLEQLNLAILVQPIQEAIASGNLKANSSNWEIQASWGLGHSIFRGEILPDYYQIDPHTSTIKVQELGKKISAYRLNLNQDSLDPNPVYLQSHLVSEEKQKQSALNEHNLGKLIALAEKLTVEQGQNFTLEWTIYQDTQNNTHPIPRIYITQFTTQLEQLTESNIQRNDSIPRNSLQPEPYLQGRGVSSGQAIAPAYVVHYPIKRTEIPAGSILVIKNLLPDSLSLLKKAVGLVAEQGSVTSHGAIMARELGIPAVVGVKSATQMVKSGDTLQIDGETGAVFRPKQPLTPKVENKDLAMEENALPIINYPLATQLMVNLSQPESISGAAALPIDGVGLLRADLMMLELMASQPLSWWLKPENQSTLKVNLTQLIIKFASSFAPRQIFYRSCDWDQEIHTQQQLSSPISLGKRGTFNYLLEPTLFEIELAAIAEVYQSGYSNVNLILPFVRSLEEFKFCLRLSEKFGLTAQPSFQLWIMAEVPSVLLLLPEYIQAGVQGIAIGTNDLTQLVLGVNREEAAMANLFDERHPAVLRAIQQLVEMAKAAQIPCSICGQATVQYPEIIPKLVHWGITSISVEPEAVEKTYRIIAQAEKNLILEAARKTISSNK